MKQRIVIKVPQKSSKALKITASIEGVDSISLQGDDTKDHIVVTGEGIDPVYLTSLLRKKLGTANLVSVNPIDDHFTVTTESQIQHTAHPVCWPDFRPPYLFPCDLQGYSNFENCGYW